MLVCTLKLDLEFEERYEILILYFVVRKLLVYLLYLHYALDEENNGYVAMQ